jgi:hypothetical protein
MPPARPTPVPVPVAAPASAGDRLDDDILGGAELIAEPDGAAVGGDAYYQQVFDQFLALKKSCGESITGLTFDKFAAKLRKNRDDLVVKTACKDVKFTVYVKDGKAALKATPVQV